MKQKAVFYILLNILFLSSFVSASLLKVTTEHPFLINNSWISASQLKPGDMLTTIDGKQARITRIERVRENVSVYNLEDEIFHNYAASGVIVHNSQKALPMPRIKQRYPRGLGPEFESFVKNPQEFFDPSIYKSGNTRQEILDFLINQRNLPEDMQIISDVDVAKFFDYSKLGWPRTNWPDPTVFESYGKSFFLNYFENRPQIRISDVNLNLRLFRGTQINRLSGTGGILPEKLGLQFQLPDGTGVAHFTVYPSYASKYSRGFNPNFLKHPEIFCDKPVLLETTFKELFSMQNAGKITKIEVNFKTKVGVPGLEIKVYVPRGQNLEGIFRYYEPANPLSLFSGNVDF